VSARPRAAPDWLFDERAHAGTEHFDPTYAAGHDAKTGADPAEDPVDPSSAMLAVARERAREVSHRRGTYATYVCAK
jgi:hypothetical protein